MAIPEKLEKLYEPIAPYLDKVRTRVGELWAEALRLVHGPDLSPPGAGGKMLRPALCLLSAGTLGVSDLGRYVELATAFELFHLAALTHDDVIDSADLRRGVTSLNVLWDDHAAILGGDYLVARATIMLSTFGSCPLIANVVESVQQMAEGELRSLGKPADSVTQEDCIYLAQHKTATLIASTCTAPTYLLDAEHRDTLFRYGEGFGIAFQLVDDILDLTQSKAELGKPSCGDVVEGKITLPILFMRTALDDAGRKRLETMTGQVLDDDGRAWVAEAFEHSGARARTEAVAHEYVDAALAALNSLPANACRESMAGLLEFVMTRDR